MRTVQRAVLWGTVILLGCSDSTEPGARAGNPALAVVVGGADQVDTVAKTLRDTIIVKITDSLAVPVPNAVVSWVATGGEPFVTASTTNTLGEARNLWKMPTLAGEYRLEARWINPVTGQARVLATVRATGTPAAPSPLNFLTTGEGGRGANGDTLNLTGAFADRYGNRVSDWRIVAVSGPAKVVSSTAGDRMAQLLIRTGDGEGTFEVRTGGGTLWGRSRFVSCMLPSGQGFIKVHNPVGATPLTCP